MRKFILTSLLALSLGACSTAQVQQAEDFIGKVQAYAAQACHFIPEVATIVSIWNSVAGATVAGVGGAICAAVPPPASARYKALNLKGAGPAVQTGIIGGIPVTGWRTQ